MKTTSWYTVRTQNTSCDSINGVRMHEIARELKQNTAATHMWQVMLGRDPGRADADKLRENIREAWQERRALKIEWYRHLNPWVAQLAEERRAASPDVRPPAPPGVSAAVWTAMLDDIDGGIR